MPHTHFIPLKTTADSLPDYNNFSMRPLGWKIPAQLRKEYGHPGITNA